jgi:TetR/AcrR family transcriptional regulator of autoinduction and epiphytic fitness
MLPQRSTDKRDGRRERSVRTHRAIVAALIDLIEEGNLAPTAAQIAKRAKVAVRSIRQHFPSREDLFVAAVGEHARRVAPLRTYVDARLPLADRVAAFAEARGRELEFCSPVRRAAMFVETAPGQSVSSAISKATDEAWQRRRREVEQVFAREIEGHADRRALMDTLDLLSHGRTWDTMRYAMQLSASDATALLRRTLAAALTP